MFVGHAMLAFALVGAGAHRIGLPARRALALALVAGLFATLPDVDILYGPVGLLGGVADIGAAVEAFWATGNEVHRGPTHSLVVGTVAALAFGLARSSRRFAPTGAALLLGIIVAVTAAGLGVVDAALLTVFGLGGFAIVGLAAHLNLSARAVSATAAVGLLTHPFGDLLTGAPPDLLFPLAASPLTGTVTLSSDPTVHLLAAFAVELATIWAASAVWCRLDGRSLRTLVDRRAGVAVGYGAMAVVLPAPSVDAAEPFVFSVLSLGVVGATPRRRTWWPGWPRVLATGLAAVTVAAVAYAVAYLLVGGP